MQGTSQNCKITSGPQPKQVINIYFSLYRSRFQEIILHGHFTASNTQKVQQGGLTVIKVQSRLQFAPKVCITTFRSVSLHLLVLRIFFNNELMTVFGYITKIWIRYKFFYHVNSKTDNKSAQSKSKMPNLALQVN